MVVEANRLFSGVGDSSCDLPLASRIMENATLNQLGDIANGGFDDLRGKEGIQLLDAFTLDQAYFDLMRLARLEVGYHEEDHFFKRGLAGALFEELANVHLASRQDLGGVVISGNELLSAMMALNQGREIIENGFGQTGINGRYIPDGLLIGEIDGELSIQGVVEVSLGKWSQKFNREKQIRGYYYLLDNLGIKEDHKPPLIVVTPQFDSPDNGYSGVSHLTVPVDKREFLDELFDYAYYKDERLDGYSLNSARQIYRRTGEVIAIPASI